MIDLDSDPEPEVIGVSPMSGRTRAGVKRKRTDASEGITAPRRRVSDDGRSVPMRPPNQLGDVIVIDD